MANKIICPNCGIINKYYIKKTLCVRECYDIEDKYISTYATKEQYSGRLKKCLKCNSKVKVVSE